MKILLTVAYDGTNYCGWQRQINGISVQEVLETALSGIFGCDITVTGASRTDSGVHALGQRVAFDMSFIKIPLDKLPFVINAKLPPDVAVLAAEAVQESFDPRYKAVDKTYEYKIYTGSYPNPLIRNYAYHAHYMLNTDNMIKAAGCFIGTHDFAAFRASGGSAKTSVRTVFECCIVPIDEKIIVLRIRGNGFLYNMVRIIAGTVLYVGMGKLEPESISGIIISGRRELAGKTLPPHGLTLIEVRY